MACQIKKQNEKITEVLASNGATSILWDQLKGLTFLNDAQREDIYVNAQSIKTTVKDDNGEPILMIQRTDVIHQNLGVGEVYTTDFTDAIMKNQGDTYSVGFIMSDNVEELETTEKTIPKQITDLFRKTTNSKAKVNKVKVNGLDNYVTTANVKNVFSINPNEDDTHAGFIIDKVRRGVLRLNDYGTPSKKQLPTRISLSAGQDVIVEPRRARGTTISGKIQDILTNSETHPYGILVRLDNGIEGRVKEIVEQEVEEEMGQKTLGKGTQIGYYMASGNYYEVEIAEVLEEKEKGANEYQYVLLTNGKIAEVSPGDVLDKPAEKSEEYIQREIFQKEVNKLGTTKATSINNRGYKMAGRGRVVLGTLWELTSKDSLEYIRNLKGEEKEIFETAIDYGASVHIIDYRGKFSHEIVVGDGSDFYHSRYNLDADGSYSSTTGVKKRVTKYNVKPSGVIQGIKKWAFEYGTIPEDTLSKVKANKKRLQENRNKRATRLITEEEARKFRRKAPRVLPEIANLFENKANAFMLASIFPKDHVYYPIISLLLEAENSLKNVTLEWQSKRPTNEGADGTFSYKGVLALNARSYSPNTTIVHELVHGVTLSAVSKYASTSDKGEKYLEFLQGFVDKEPINEVQKAVQDIAKLYLETIPQVEGLNIDDLNKRLVLRGKYYGFTNLNEFLSEGISDEQFQEILNGITVKNKSKTIFTRLIEVINDLLTALGGGRVVPDSMLESLLSETENLIRLVDENTANLSGTTVEENITDYPTEGAPQQQEDTSRINAFTVKEVWNKNRNIQFTGTTRVKNAEDVAEIMKQLENKTVEHAFAVHVDEKGDSYIQFLSIGGQVSTVIDPSLVLSGVTKFKTKKVYLVHNHPSGTLVPSKADLDITDKIRDGLIPLKIDLEHVIIDTYKKSYVHIKSDNTFTVNKRGERELKDELEVYNVTDKEFISEPMGQIGDPNDVFKFVQNLRFSALPKKAVLLLDNGNNIIANYILQKGVDFKEITDLIGEIGGTRSIILYGNYADAVETNTLKNRLLKLEINVLDDVTIGSKGNSVAEYYVSMNSRNLLLEHQEKYNTNEVNEPFNSDYNNRQLLEPRLSSETQEQTVTVQDIGAVNGKRVIAASLAGQRVGSLTLVEQDGNFVTDTISVSEGYRGLGIAGEMYLEAANELDKPIMSDMYRTAEAEAVWDKLFLEGKAQKTSNGRYLITKEAPRQQATDKQKIIKEGQKLPQTPIQTKNKYGEITSGKVHLYHSTNGVENLNNILENGIDFEKQQAVSGLFFSKLGTPYRQNDSFVVIETDVENIPPNQRNDGQEVALGQLSDYKIVHSSKMSPTELKSLSTLEKILNRDGVDGYNKALDNYKKRNKNSELVKYLEGASPMQTDINIDTEVATDKEKTEFVYSQLEKAGLVDEYYLMTNEQIESELKRRGYSDDIVSQVIENKEKFSKTIYPTGQKTFVSNALTGLDKVNQKSATPAQWVKMISDNGGKGTAQELGWIGLEDYLKEWMQENKAKSIPFEVVKKYINDNQIEIAQVTKGDTADITWKDNGYGFIVSQQYVYEIRPDYGKYELYRGLGLISIHDTLEEAKNKAVEFENKEAANKVGGVKYANYTLEGGKNYREVLLTLPKGKGQAYAEKMTNKYGIDLDPTQIYEQMSESEKETQAKLNNEDGVQYKSGHWDESNILAHLRINERALPNGERVMFIEELQSDWAQEGKKKGFEGPNSLRVKREIIEKALLEEEYKIEKLQEQKDSIKDIPKEDAIEINRKIFKLEEKLDTVRNTREFDTYANEISKLQGKLNSPSIERDNLEEKIDALKFGSERRRLQNELYEFDRDNPIVEKAVLDMPYKKTDQWAGMAMRRVMQMAAEEGFDRVAWVTGEQSAERYNLSNQVESISAIQEMKDGNNTGIYSLFATKDGATVFSQYDVKESELESYVGKDLANNIIEENKTNPYFPKTEFEGKDLKVGGEGMRAFYNSILTKVSKKEAQRFDKKANVEVVDFQSKSDIGEVVDKVINEFNEGDVNYKDYKTTKGFVVTKITNGEDVSYNVYNQNEQQVGSNVKDLNDVKVSVKNDIESANPSKQFSIAITPKMKDNLSKGIPMFNKYQSPITVTTNGFYINENGLSKVYVNKNASNVNGINIHEYGHAYLEQLEKTNPEIYQKGEQLIEQELGKAKSEIKDIIDLVKTNQPNLQGRGLINEILNQTIQQQGEKIVNNKNKSNIKDWINQFLDWLKGKLGLTQYSNSEVLAMNLSEYSEAAAVDLLQGEELFVGEQAGTATEAAASSESNDAKFQLNEETLKLFETDYDLMIEDMIEKGEITQNCKL